MNWYYVDGGQQAGPVNDADFDALVQSGKVQPDTLAKVAVASGGFEAVLGKTHRTEF